MNYIGSKYSILDFIDETVIDFAHPEHNNYTFCDIFAGTAVVSKYFKKKGCSVIANDIESYSYMIIKSLIENNEEYQYKKLKENKIDDPFTYLNNLDGIEGFIYKNYSLGGTKGQETERLYFSDYNAKKIDAIRTEIKSWKEKELITENEFCYLVASLVESADKVANTASVYEAFLKKLKASAAKPLVYQPIDCPIIEKNGKYKAYNEDSNELIKHISGDVLYMDPPYNNRKYDTNYHILETIALYDEPEIKGKTGLRIENSKKSKYCVRKEATSAFEELVKNANFKYLFLSYNDEGIIPMAEIRRIMSKYGKYKCYSKKHKRYKSDTKREYIKDFTIEYIHCLEKNSKFLYEDHIEKNDSNIE